MPFPFYTRPPFEDRQLVQYSGTSITLSGDTNVYPTGNLRIYKNAFPGLVATSIDADGTVGWGPISGISWSVSACTSPLYVNNLVSCPLSAGTIQVDAGSFDLNSELRFLISLSAGTNNDEVLVVDSNGYVKSVSNLGGIGNMWYVPFGYTLTVPDNYQSFIYGDLYVLGTIDLQTNAQLVVLNGNIILSGGSIIGSGTTQLVTLGDSYVTGGTFNNSNGTLTLNRQNGSVVITGFTGGGGGGTFTGNTSASCITDLYLTNIYGCGNDVNIISTTNITGNTYINGTLYATSKSFSIPHPLDENKLLVYGSLEGPENGVYHRGKLIDYNVIQLPDYWSKLVDINTVTVNLTPNGKYQNLFVKEILEDKIIIDINNGWFGNEKINCFYTVYGERKDIDKLKVER
jgi:hypothetical protein